MLKGIGRLFCSDDGKWMGVPPVCLSKKWLLTLHYKMFMIVRYFEIHLTGIFLACVFNCMLNKTT